MTNDYGKLEVLTKAQLAKDLSFIIEGSGVFNNRVIADLLRAPLARWGLSSKSNVLQYARNQLKAVGIDGSKQVSLMLSKLIAIGECMEVEVGHEVFLAPCKPAWIQVSSDIGVYLGVYSLPNEIECVVSSESNDIVQRMYIKTDEDRVQLSAAGISEQTLHEWFSPLKYLDHASRRTGQPVRHDLLTLSGFWDLLEDDFNSNSKVIGEDVEIRGVVGPGAFFGNYKVNPVTGRWSTNIPDGLWCGMRKGYGENHWNPILVGAQAGHRRVLDLYDHDEWNWALLARGKNCGIEERIEYKEEQVKLGFPAPIQLRTALDILGVASSESKWTWDVPSGITDIRDWLV